MGNCGGGNKNQKQRDTLHKPKLGEFGNDEDNDLKMKCCMAGDVGVGKSLFYHTFFNTIDKFTNTTTQASGDNNCTTVKSKEGDVRLSIWDTAGQERYMTITKIFYKGADGIVLLFDVTKKETFTRIESFWLQELKKEMNVDECVLTLIGNKCDLPNRQVSEDEAKEFAKSRNMIYREVSALKNQGIDEAIKTTVEEINSKRKALGRNANN
jgi:small GTP-binding protein